MNYLTLFEGKALFDKVRPLLDLRAELDLRLTKYFENKTCLSIQVNLKANKKGELIRATLMDVQKTIFEVFKMKLMIKCTYSIFFTDGLLTMK